jgi:hypothetical protein
VHPHLTLLHSTPLLWLILMVMKVKRAENRMKTMSEASLEDSSTSFSVLNDKGGEVSIKAWRLIFPVFHYVPSEKIGLSGFANRSIWFCLDRTLIYFSFLVSSGLEDIYVMCETLC